MLELGPQPDPNVTYLYGGLTPEERDAQREDDTMGGFRAYDLPSPEAQAWMAAHLARVEPVGASTTASEKSERDVPLQHRISRSTKEIGRRHIPDVKEILKNSSLDENNT